MIGKVTPAEMTDQTTTARPGPWTRLVAWWHQRSYPHEFRIGPPPVPSEISELHRRVTALEQAPPPGPGEPAAPDDDHDAGLVEVAMGYWRTRRRVEATDAGKLQRQVRLHLDRTKDGLDRLGVGVQDHDEEPFYSGLDLTVAAIQPHPGITRETIIETVQPTITHQGRRIQVGHVVVGQPEGPVDA